MKKEFKLFVLVMLCNVLFIANGFAAERTVDLHVAYKTVNFAGKSVKAIAVNNQIPAPALHFQEGDHITINVYNHLDKETAIHWHGMLVPWQMDGVEGVTQKGIRPGNVFHYQFTLHQAGTYWYHAHAGLQEQQGLYGAFLIDPPQKPPYRYTKDYVIVLSDWSNTQPEQILANLKKAGDYYAPRFPLQPSLTKFIHDYRKASMQERKNIIDDYKMMQQMRMSIYDISDVAYDAFLLNGQPNATPWTAPVKAGDSVRLRFIGAGAATIFNVKIPGTAMQMVHVQGNDVKPYAINDFKIAPGETFDVLVKIQKNTPYIIYAESIDTLGAAYGALVTAPSQWVNYQQVTPFPEPKPVMREMMSLMMNNHDSSSMQMHHSHPMNALKNGSIHMSGMNMDHHMPMNHSMDMSMSTEPTVVGDAISSPKSYQKTIGTKYQAIVAAVKTNNPDKPVDGVIKMELFGDMDRFTWFINGVPEYKAHPIVLEPSKRYRFIFTNTSMMRHPMHIHGHWFVLRNGHGSYDPLLHTLDIPPGATVTADVDTDASGQWFFHCHLLYHMMSGMSRVFQYATLIEITQDEAKPQNIIKQTPYLNRPIVRVDEARPIDVSLVKHPMAHPAGVWLANFLDVNEDPFHNVQELTFKGLYGGDYNKLELFVNEAEIGQGAVDDADLDIFYWHLLSQFWAIKGGANYFYQPSTHPYWQPGIGIEGLMPYFIDTNIRGYYHANSAKLDIELSRDTQIANNFFIRMDLRSILATKTVTAAEIGSGLNEIRAAVRPYYRVIPGLAVYAEYEHEQYYGPVRSLRRNADESNSQNTLSFGILWLF
ncbi:MAG: copper oxidase [Gammaproteobacteria bacterium RIFCSPHIGHO2_12_FULL_41_20]|nr:MAG: copper oxidase [Gammaproteobacteria bacterium RIFCSPHIGHO2_12_FULL_41_20]